MLIDRLDSHSTVWIIAPHADDEVLGCGGLISVGSDVGSKVVVLFISVAGGPLRSGGTVVTHAERREELARVMSAADVHGYDVLFAEGEYHLELDRVPVKTIADWMEWKSTWSFETMNPDVILIPSSRHHNQDHRRVSEAALTLTRTNPRLATRGRVFLEYELPGTAGFGFGRFDPNLYFELSPKVLKRKCDLFDLYHSQNAGGIHPRSRHAIESLAAQRGSEAGFEFAEAYRLVRGHYKSVVGEDRK